jgi:hypothetical protein
MNIHYDNYQISEVRFNYRHYKHPNIIILAKHLYK